MFDKFGERFKQIRKENNLTQTEIGERLGLSLPTIHRLENSDKPPRTDVIIALTDEFNCDPTWLLTGKHYQLNGNTNKEGELKVFQRKNQEAVGVVQLPEISGGSKIIKIDGDDLMPVVSKGDYVVTSDESPTTGDIVLFENEWGEIKARRFRDVDGGELVAESPDFQIIKIRGPIKLIGKATHVLKVARL